MKILIVDDDVLIREGLKLILESVEDIEVSGIAANGQEAVKLCAASRPDVVLMDIRMPVMDGVQATQQIKQQFRDVKVVLLTTFKDTEYIRSAVKYGADGYILKSNSSENIIESIRTVYKGNVVYEKEITAALSGMIPEERKTTALEANIIVRELKIMKMIADGLSNREIAAALFISEGTLRNITSALLDKLGLRDRTQLAVYYIRNLENKGQGE
jgi:DNA-binding NarL/FixJ family response regulator